MIDSHCHLDHEPLYSNISDVIKRSKENGLKKILTISTNSKSFENIKKIINLDKIIYQLPYFQLFLQLCSYLQ